jgi:hypothetical protein
MMANRLTKLEFENQDLKEELSKKTTLLDKYSSQLEIYNKKPVKDI